MAISRIPNIELQEAIPIKNWVGWHVGWWTGWYNPFDRLGDRVNPAELGKLVVIQGEFMQEQARIMGEQGRIVQGLGEKLANFDRTTAAGKKG